MDQKVPMLKGKNPCFLRMCLPVVKEYLEGDHLILIPAQFEDPCRILGFLPLKNPKDQRKLENNSENINRCKEWKNQFCDAVL